MKNNLIGICITLSLVATLSSCIGEIEDMGTHPTIVSEYIIFGGTSANDVVVTRSGDAISPRFFENVLKSATEDISLPLYVKVEQGINNAGPATRAVVTSTIDEITQLDAWATKNTYSDASKNQIIDRELFFYGSDGKAETGALFTKETGNDDINGDGTVDDIFYPDGNGPYPWEKNSNNVSDFNFVTVSPAGSGFKAVINEETMTVTFDYEVPAAASEQKDILVAVPDPVPVNYGAPVPLDYKHVMAAVNVKVGNKMPAGVIRSIKFNGVYDKASYYPASNEWTNRSIRENGGVFNVTLPEGGLSVGPDVLGNAITNAETSFMMIPQQLFTGAELEVEFHDNTSNKDVTLRASLQGDVWEMNTTTNYLINIDANYNISIVPLDKVLDSHYIITKVEVSSEFQNWTLTAVANDGAAVTVQPESEVNPMAKQGFWTDKIASKDANGNYYVANNAASARGTNSCRGTQGENQIIYVFIPENVSGETRSVTLTIEGFGPTGNGVKQLVLTQESVKWLDPTGTGETYWGCELLLEGGQVPWGFCFENLREEWRVKGKGGGSNQPPGWITKIADAMTAAGLDVNRLYQDDSPIRIITKDEHKSEFLIYIDYGMLGNIDIADDPLDGPQNTLDLYTFDGINLISSIKAFLVAAGDEIEHVPGTFTGEIESTLDYAAMYAMKRNRFHYYETVIDGTPMNLPVIDAQKDLNWYLPAKDQFPVFMNTNWGQQFTFNDLFWTSTAYLTDTETDNAHSYAYINGIESISHRLDKYLTFAIRRYTISGEVGIPDSDDIIIPGGDINGGGNGGDNGNQEGGGIGGGIQ